MNLGLIVLAFFAGMFGAATGGTQVFILTGIFGIIGHILTLNGIVIPFFNDIILNLILVPCISFNGAALATAYASKHHNIRGIDTNRSLLFTGDYKVFICGGIGGVVGYLLLTLFTYLKLPLDIGGLVVGLVGFGIRAIFSGKFVSKEKFVPSKAALINMLSFQVAFAIIIAFATALLVKATGIVGFGFSISAASLYFGFKYPSFPATHQMTMVAGYAYGQTGDIFITVLFTIAAQLIFTVFGMKCNTDLGTHIDPPAIAIAALSFIIFVFF